MKKIKVEKLLSWAFLHELSKGGGANGLNSSLSAWGRMEGVISLGVRIDLNRARQDLPEQFEQGDPHPDAVIIGQAVRDLAKHDFGNLDVPFDALPLASWSDEAKEIAKPIFQTVVESYNKRSNVAKSRSLIALVISCAVRETKPVIHLTKPKVEKLCMNGYPCWFVKRIYVDSFGREREVEVMGRNPKTGRPFKNAYQKSVLVPSPEAAMDSFLDLQCWNMALDFIFSKIDGTLKDFKPVR